MTICLHSAKLWLALAVAVVVPAIGCASAAGKAKADPVPGNDDGGQITDVAAPPASEPTDEPPDPDLWPYDYLRQEIQRAGNARKVGKLRSLVIDIDNELVEPAQLPTTTCWQHLKSTALVELDRVDDARETLKLIVDTCPVWEALNNLAVLEAGDGQFGRAQSRLRDAQKKAEKELEVGAPTPEEEQRAKIPQRNLRNLRSDDEELFLILAGMIGECSGKAVPVADCGGKVEATATLMAGGEAIPARFAVFAVADGATRGEPVAESAGEQSRFEAVVPDGTYVVAAAVGSAFVQREVTVGAGSTNSLNLAMDAGRINASWRLAPGSEPEPARFRVLRNGETVVQSDEPVSRFSVIVPSGGYQVLAERGAISLSIPQTVSPGADIELTLDPGVAAALEAWRRAWSAGDVEAFLAAYEENFTPDPNISPAGWARDRRRKIENKATIDVAVGDARYSWAAPDQVRVSFTQDYRSTPADGSRSSFCSRGSKTLTFERMASDWKIVRSECSSCDQRAACP